MILEVEVATAALCAVGASDLGEMGRVANWRAGVLKNLVHAALHSKFQDIPTATLDRLSAVLDSGEQAIKALRQGRRALLEEMRGLKQERSCLPAAGEYAHLEFLA